METEQNYLAVGIFVVAITLGILGFFAWKAGLDKEDYTIYQTFFTESVNGLGLGAPVKYRGVDVGKVQTIEIDKTDPANIHIEMQIADGTPITPSTVANLQLQGITGTSFIELRGALAGEDLMKPTNKYDVPVIPSVPSKFQQIVDTVPEVLQKFSQLAEKLGGFASEENSVRFAALLDNLEKFSDGVAGENGQGLMNELQQTTTEMGKAASAITDIATSSRADTQRILHSTSETLDKIGKLVDQTGQVSQASANDLRQLLLEMKKSARDIQGLSQTLKDNPSQIIIPTKPGGVEAK